MMYALKRRIWRKENCNLAFITTFVMLCISDPDLRSMLAVIYMEPQIFAQYADWAFQDRVEDRAGVFDAMERLNSLLGLESFGLRSRS